MSNKDSQKRTTLRAFSKRVSSRFTSTLRDQDVFGQPVTLNYQGSETFKTLPGGLLSIFFMICLGAYFFLKLKYMVNKQEWTIKSQTMVAEPKELNQTTKFSHPNQGNISIAFQISNKRPRLTMEDKKSPRKSAANMTQEEKNKVRDRQDKEYQEEVKNISEYISIYGMFEEQVGAQFYTYGGINEDNFAWKKYPHEIRTNKHNLKEFVVSLEDAVLRGTSDSINAMDQVIPRFQLRANEARFELEAQRLCASDHFYGEMTKTYSDLSDIGEVFCSEYLDFGFSNIINELYTWGYEEYQNGDEEKRQEVEEAFKEYERVMQNQTAENVAGLLHSYYSEKMISRLTLLEDYYMANIAGVYDHASQGFYAALAVLQSSGSARRLQEVGAVRDDDGEGGEEVSSKPFDDNRSSDSNGAPRDLQTVSVSKVIDIYQYNIKEGGNITQFIDFMADFSSFVDQQTNATFIQKTLEFIAMKKRYKMYYYNYIQTLSMLQENLFNKYSFDLVVYDEIETFRHYADPLFSYPYGSRTTYVNAMTADISNVEFFMATDFEYYSKKLWQPYDYAYSANSVYFQKSDVCLEGHYTDQLLFLGEVGSQIKEMIAPSGNAPEYCDDKNFHSKMKFSKASHDKPQLYDSYELGVIEDKILFEITLFLDPMKTVSMRDSTKFLDFFGDVGGFEQAIHILFGVFGSFFSCKLFVAHIASKFFIERKSHREIAQVYRSKLKDRIKAKLQGIKSPEVTEVEPQVNNCSDLKQLFKPLHFSTASLFLDSLWHFICCPISLCTAGCSFRRRSKKLEKVDERFNEQLEVTSLLKKVNETSTMLKQLATRETKQLIKYNKQNLIGSSEEGSSSGVDPANSSDDRGAELELAAQSNPILDQLQEAMKLSVISMTELSPEQKQNLIQNLEKEKQQQPQQQIQFSSSGSSWNRNRKKSSSIIRMGDQTGEPSGILDEAADFDHPELNNQYLTSFGGGKNYMARGVLSGVQANTEAKVNKRKKLRKKKTEVIEMNSDLIHEHLQSEMKLMEPFDYYGSKQRRR